MKSILITTLLLLIVSSAAQEPLTKQPSAFHWNSGAVQDVGSQTIATFKNISPTERASLLDALAARFKGNPKPMERAAQTHVKFVDLNGDGVPEVIAQPSGDGICSPTGNCPFWVFQKFGNIYRLILAKGAVQEFTIQQTRTNGYSDLVLGMHGSATLQGLFVYQFLDGRYRQTGCYDANWSYLAKDGEYHDLDEPRITPCGK